MATEDFTTYTETDPADNITVDSASQVTVTTLLRNTDTFLYKDKGAGHYAENFRHKFRTQQTYGSANGTCIFWSLTNDVDDRAALSAGNKSALFCEWYNRTARMLELDSGTNYVDVTAALSDATNYYMTVERDEAVGTYGTIYLYIYSDAGRTTLLDTLTLALHTSKKDFQYQFAVMSFNNNTTNYVSGVIADLDLQEGTAKLAAHHYRMRRTG